LKRQWLTNLIGATILLLGIGVLLAAMNTNASFCNSPFVQNLLIYPDCDQIDALEGLGIVLIMIGLLLFVIGFAEPDQDKSATQPVAMPATVQGPIGCVRTMSDYSWSRTCNSRW